MNIKIWDDKYIIKSDSRQYKLIEIKEKLQADEDDEAIDATANTDGTYEINIGYYSDLTHLFEALVKREGRLNKCTTLEGYVRHIEKINKRLEENLNSIKATIGQKESFKRIMDSMPDKIPAEVAQIGEEEAPKPKKETKKRKKK